MKLEIILPSTTDLLGDIGKILSPFYDGGDNEKAYVFYDTCGLCAYRPEKLTFMFGENRVIDFQRALGDIGVHLKDRDDLYPILDGNLVLPSSFEIPSVQEIWRNHFPEFSDFCPLFLRDGIWSLCPDALPLESVPKHFSVARVIIAGKEDEGASPEPVFMIAQHNYNGVSHIKANWDGTVRGATDIYRNGPYAKPNMYGRFLSVTLTY